MKCEDCMWQGFEVSSTGLIPVCTLDMKPGEDYCTSNNTDEDGDDL